MLKNYRNFLMAGVISLGLAACGDDLSIIEPPPPPEVPNITTFTVAPTSATIAPGTFVQASVTLITKPGVTGSVAWVSSNPAVATVDASGRIDALTEGTTVVTATATAGGETATAAIGVTVRPITPASISIQSITNANLGTPVNIGNVMGQIEINLNFDPGEEIVDSVAVFIGSEQAASQVFATSPSAGPITLSVNTANYVKNVAAGTAEVDFENGATTISAAVYPRGAQATATNSIQIVLNNADGWAGDFIKPDRVATSSGGVSYWGGPGEDGLAELTVYPVIYTPGRSVTSVTFRPGRVGFVGCDNTTMTTMPFRATYGYASAGADVDCSGETGSPYEWVGGPFTPRDNIVVVAAIDNASTPFAAPAPLIANTIVLGSTPDSLRVDWEGPNGGGFVAVPTVEGHEGQDWVKADWEFNPGGTLVSDDGVGASSSSWAAVVLAGGTVDDTVAVGADLPETNTNLVAVDGYQLQGVAHDLLFNPDSSGASDEFGVDVTMPQIRYTDIGDLASIYTDGGDTTEPDSTEYAAFSGMYGVDAGAAATGDIVDYIGAAAGDNDSIRTEAIDNRSGLFRAVITSDVFAQGGATGTVSPTLCGTTTGTFGISMVDGWRPAPQVHVTCGSTDAGYYTTSQAAVDAAGNMSTVYKRTLAFDPGQPAVTGVSPNASYTGNAPAPFTIGAQDDLEVIGGSLRISYPNVFQGDGATASGGLRWTYAEFTPFATEFDASIINPLIGTMNVDQFTVSVQETCEAGYAFLSCAGNSDGDPIPDAENTLSKPDAVGAMVRDVFGSWVDNFTAGAMTGVAAELVSPILSATVPAVSAFSVTYDASGNCPQGGVVGGACVIGGINFRADGISGSDYAYRAVQDMNVTLPVFTRVDLFGLNAVGEWVYIQRITVPAVISPTGSPIPAGDGTITGSDNSFERYWVYTFTDVPSGFSAYRALGVNSTGHGLFSTDQ